jgi:exonuclease SbcC
MRLHRLELTAFGPFGGTEAVDFDALNAAGIFLLCGPTGAGKTSVLDGVCFAFFGCVPGERGQARALRSDHAPAELGPQVVLEATVRDRRLRITRSPSWSRPKRRGSGMTAEPAKVIVEEQVDGAWSGLTTRLDEAGDLLCGLLGMNAEQFCQVALLPQGGFQAFLRAGSKDRQAVLERLFGTARFRLVEDWLVERRRQLGTESRRLELEVTSVLDRMAEASAADRPDVLDAACGWSEAQAQVALARLARLQTRCDEAEQALKLAQADRDAVAALADRQARHRQALRRLEELQAGAAQAVELASAAGAARRAAGVAPVLDVLSRAQQDTKTARALATEACARLPAEARWAASTAGGIDAELRAQREELARLQALSVQDEERKALVQALAVLTADVEQLRRDGATAEASLASRSERRDALVRRRGALTDQAQQVGALRMTVAGAHGVLSAAEQALPLERRLRELDTSVHAAVDQQQAARQRLLDIRQARIDGMAAELAAGLREGLPCPVCGALDHPIVARPVALRPGPAEERAAALAADRADAARTEAERMRADVASQLSAARAAAEGHDVEAARTMLLSAQGELDAAQAAADELSALDRDLADLTAQVSSTQSELAAVQVELAGRTQRRAALRQQAETLAASIAAACGGQVSLGDRINAVSKRSDALERAQAALTELRTAQQHSDRIAAQALAAARTADFPDLAAVEAALLPETVLANHETLLRHRAQQLDDVHALLADPATATAAAGEPADLLAAEAAMGSAADELASLRIQLAEAAKCAERVEALSAVLDHRLARWQPVQDAYAVAARISALCAGTSTDNAARMRLSAYVLAARLEQVVAAANQRLELMSAGRYLLEHTVERGVGDTRGGLGLLIRDGWTGEPRDPATLSGGETFVTSLALALGLADVVSEESGAAELATLFVDEGFGSLDADTLDEVLDVLDGLRSSGRVIGVVSHVGDMLARFPTQLRVIKGRTGSRLETCGTPAAGLPGGR